MKIAQKIHISFGIDTLHFVGFIPIISYCGLRPAQQFRLAGTAFVCDFNISSPTLFKL